MSDRNPNAIQHSSAEVFGWLRDSLLVWLAIVVPVLWAIRSGLL